MHSREPRRRHGEELKAKVLAACDEPGASVAAVARAHDLNANLVHKWRRGRGTAAADRASPVVDVAATNVGEFIAAQPDAGVTGIAVNCVVAADYCNDAGGHSRRSQTRYDDDHGELADIGRQRLRGLAARVGSMIRIDGLWLCTAPLDMRAGADRLLARVVEVFNVPWRKRRAAVRWWRTSTRGCARTSRCVATLAARTWTCCSSSSTTGASCAAVVFSARTRARAR